MGVSFKSQQIVQHFGKRALRQHLAANYAGSVEVNIMVDKLKVSEVVKDGLYVGRSSVNITLQWEI